MCDTFVALPTATEDQSVILAKNSDREANEMQALEYFEGAEYAPGEKLKCTYIEIEQVEKTNAILIGRPFWMWGAEMGTNDKGVAIGNEAIWTKMPLHKKNDRLLGMDLLRLALERADSAKKALEVICHLIETYGQGGIAGFKDKNMAYHNSFLIADKNEAWVLETADYLWVAKKVKHYYSISNGATIGGDFDLAHPELIATAIKKGWHKKGAKFNFSKAYSDWFYTVFSAS
ncbi:MAG: C69 family dipeptidase, partial [Flavobacteriaceae bacterium]|nr:C69 family dipeptidase [Flavobacteriaceae bacterium]